MMHPSDSAVMSLGRPGAPERSSSHPRGTPRLSRRAFLPPVLSCCPTLHLRLCCLAPCCGHFQAARQLEAATDVSAMCASPIQGKRVGYEGGSGKGKGKGKGKRPECCRGSMDSACWSVDLEGLRSEAPLPECPQRPVGMILDDFLRQFAANTVVDGAGDNSYSYSNSNSSSGSLDSRGTLEGGTQKLEDAMGVAQHHDGVSGTAAQHVNDDYTKRLYIGALEVRGH